ncbi:MAG: VCBS repeat-containing protein, partial [Planctomycetota bacterium]
TAGDFDGDGRIDVASLDSVPGSDSGTVSLGLGTGSGSFVALAPVPIPQLTLSFLEAGDFDQDGALDLIAGTEANDRFELLRLISAATVPVATSHVGGIGNGATLLAARVHDLNDDGWPDVVVGGRTWSDRRFWLVAGAPGANLAPPTTLIVEGFNSGATDRIWVEDLDRDGSAEIAGFGGYGIHTTVHQLVAGSWQSSASYVGWSAGPILADPDNDGDVDWIGPGMLKPSMLCVPNILHAPSGLAAYGAGTPSCDGQITSVANVAPKVGESQFKLSWTNAPPTAQALVGIAFAPDPAGSDVFGVGVKIHIGLLGPVLAYPVASDASGAASLAFPVPNVPELAGFKAYAQALWIEPAWQSCSSSPLPWSTSTGLEVTVLP